MAEHHVNEYTPDSVSLPGETLQEVLNERQMTQADLAERMGRPKKTVNEIVQGKAAITPETALQLECSEWKHCFRCVGSASWRPKSSLTRARENPDR